MDHDKRLNSDNLAAEERLLSDKIKEMLQAIFEGFVSPTAISSSLVSEGEGKFRRVECRIECSPEVLESVQEVCAEQLGVLKRDDDAGTRTIRVLCTISPIVFQQTSLPGNYPQTFLIDIAANDELAASPANNNGDDFRMDKATNKTPSDEDEKKITLLLSGGGFRATLFHLGVIRYLRETNKLKNVKEVFSISGGSIFAGHLAANWSDYTGDEEQFNRAAKKLVEFTKRGLREEILRNSGLFWLFCGASCVALLTCIWLWFEFTAVFCLTLLLIACLAGVLFYLLERKFRPIDFLRRAYHDLFDEKTISSVALASPEFYFLATNLTTGSIACFTKKGIYPSFDESKKTKDQFFVESKLCTLSESVAASSAFPPMFTPYAFLPKRFKVDKTELSKPQYFTDGGVYDNLGIRAYKLLSEKQSEVFVSDAERRFDWSTDTTFRGLTGRASRAMDILMNRVNLLEFELIESTGVVRGGSEVLPKFARLKDDFNGQAGADAVLLSPELKKSTRRIRTDLDSFSDIEIQLLYTAGYSAAKVADGDTADLGQRIVLADCGVPKACGDGKWLPISNLPELSTQEALDALEASEKVNLWKTFSLRAWQCWIAVLLLIAVLIFNPLTISLLQKVRLSPSDIKGNQIVFFGEDVPHWYSVPSAFVKTAMELSPTDGRKKNFLFVESDRIRSALSMPFGVAAFEFKVAPPPECDVFYEKAFLLFDETKSVSVLKKLNGTPQSYEVSSANGNCRLLMLIGVATDEDSEVEIKPSVFIFEVGNHHE